MGKPLLTDDIIEQAKRGEIDLEEHPYYENMIKSSTMRIMRLITSLLPTRAVELRMPNAINFNTSLIAFSFGLSYS